jgi:hypothetical protein
MASTFDGDWEKWRLRYVSGTDTLTLEALSQEPGAPALNTLKKRSSRESWTEQRKRFRHQASTTAHQDAVIGKAAEKVEQIIDAAEMLTRHSKACKLIGRLAVQAFQGYDPATLKPTEAIAMMRLALEYERLTEGHATQRQSLSVDLSGLSDSELEEIANGG